MKNALIILIVNLSICMGMAQTKGVQVNKPLSNRNLNLGNTILQSAKIDVLANQNINKKVNIYRLTKLQISYEDLNKTGVRMKRITPLKPIIPGLDISFYGTFKKDHFIFLSKSATGLEPLALLIIPESTYDAMFLYSGRLLFNARRGKEYRCTFTVKPLEGGSIIARIGQNDYSIPVDPGSKSFSFTFWSQRAGNIKIQISPEVIDKTRPYKLRSLFVKSIQIDEI